MDCARVTWAGSLHRGQLPGLGEPQDLEVEARGPEGGRFGGLQRLLALAVSHPRAPRQGEGHLLWTGGRAVGRLKGHLMGGCE